MTISVTIYSKYEDVENVYTYKTAIGFMNMGEFTVITCKDDMGLITTYNYSTDIIREIKVTLKDNESTKIISSSGKSSC